MDELLGLSAPGGSGKLCTALFEVSIQLVLAALVAVALAELGPALLRPPSETALILPGLVG